MASRQQTLKLGAVAIAAAVLTQVLSPASAAPIVWTGTTTISGTGDQVLTTGTLHAAVRFGNSTSGTLTAPTVNGVTFTQLAVPLTGTSTVVNNISVTGGNFTTDNVPPTGVSGNYLQLFPTTLYLAATPTFTISNLTKDAVYLLQYWANSSRADSGSRTMRLSSTGGANAVFSINTAAASGPGQFVTGTFKADALTQTFTAAGVSTGRMAMSALQVRLLAVPEPSTLALASLGIVSVGTWFGRRRMRRAAEESSAADTGATA